VAFQTLEFGIKLIGRRFLCVGNFARWTGIELGALQDGQGVVESPKTRFYVRFSIGPIEAVDTLKGASFTFDLALKLRVSSGRAREAADGRYFVSVVSSRTRMFDSILAVIARLAWGEPSSSVGGVCSVEVRSESRDDLAVEACHPGRGWTRELQPRSAIHISAPFKATIYTGVVKDFLSSTARRTLCFARFRDLSGRTR
jgi:hypothetical protein